MNAFDWNGKKSSCDRNYHAEHDKNNGSLLFYTAVLLVSAAVLLVLEAK